MKKKSLVIAATCLVITVLSFLLQPAYASSSIQDPLTDFIELIASIVAVIIRFLVWLVESFLAFLAQLFGV